MVLMEENINEVVLFRMGAKLHGLVVDVMKMAVIEHLSHESKIKDKGIKQAAHKTQCIAQGKIGRKKGAGQAHKDQGDQENIGVKVHAPPKTVTKGVPENLSLPRKIGVRAVDLDENSPKEGA